MVRGMTDEQRFKAFTKELSKISEKYGVTVKSIGGVIIYDEGELSQVKYSSDYTSGDLIPSIK
jgi:hypothetical protein